MPDNDLSRRTVLAASALWPMLGAASACARPGGNAIGPGSKLLVAYFTRSGNTQVIAGTIHRALKTDLFQIRPARPYPADYEENVQQAAEETARGYEPPLEARVTNLAAYDAVFLGHPVWGMTLPPVIRSFLRAHDFRGKTIRPFITHGGYGLGNCVELLNHHAPGARIEKSFVMEADQEKRTLGEVRGWLGGIG